MKKVIGLVICCLLLSSSVAFGATKAFVPRADNEGGLGTSLKRWQDNFMVDLNIEGSLTLATSGTINASAGNLEIPNSTSLPGTCEAGEIYMDTNATAGQQIYGCESGSWVLQGDGNSGASLFTDGGAITYLTSFTDNLAIGGSLATDEFYFNVSSALMIAQGGFQSGDGTNTSDDIICFNRAGTNACLSWDETNDEIDSNFPINVGGTGNLLTFGNAESINNATDDMIVFTGSLGTDDTDIQFDLDGTRPVISSPTDSAIEIAETLYINDGSNTGAIKPLHDFSFVLESPVNTDNFILKKFPYAVTIVSIDGIIDPADSAENLNINIRECDGTADSCATVSGTINIDNDGTTDSSHTNATIDAGDWVDLYINTVGSTLPDALSGTVTYTID